MASLKLMARISVLIILGLAITHFASAEVIASSTTDDARITGLDILPSKLSASRPAWNIARLTGLQSFHDGPNCYNSVLVVKGFNDYLKQSSDSELKYYVDHFCKPVLGRAAPGDVLIVERESGYEHAVIFMGHRQIFEKTSLGGLYGKNLEWHDPSDYHIQDLARSSYFNECAAPICEVKKFRCAPTTEVRSKMNACFETAEQLGLRKIQADFQEEALNPVRQVRVESTTLAAVASFKIKLNRLSGSGPCDSYVLALGDGIVWQLMNQPNLSSKDVELWRELDADLRKFKSRIEVQSRVSTAKD